jgi:hypothetical protein
MESLRVFTWPVVKVLLIDNALKVEVRLITHQKIVYKIWILIYHVDRKQVGSHGQYPSVRALFESYTKAVEIFV